MNYKKISVYLIGCLLIWVPSAFAQQVRVSAKLDTTSILLGDQTILRLSATFPVKDHINFPALSDTLSSKLLIVEEGKADTVKDRMNPGQHTITRQFTITSFDAGMQTVPSFTFETTAGQMKTEPMPLQVLEVKVDTTKAIFDIKQPLGVSYGWMDWVRDHWYWLLAGLAAIAGLVAAWLYYRKRQKPEVMAVQVPEPLVAPHVLAIEKLFALKDKKLWEQDLTKLYYVELTDILREFLEGRYQISAMEQTSDEIFQSLARQEMKAESRALLRQVLTLADLVKFAKATPLRSENEQSMEAAIAFVKDAAVNESILVSKTPEA